MTVACKNCKWFTVDRYSDTGHCRRLPPTASQNGDHALFPIVRDEWFCGEFAVPSWHPSQGEPDRNAPGYGLILEFVKASQRKNTATRATNKEKANGKEKESTKK